MFVSWRDGAWRFGQVERTAVIPVNASGLVESAVTCPIYHPPHVCVETIYQMKHKWAVSILSLFPKGHYMMDKDIPGILTLVTV